MCPVLIIDSSGVGSRKITYKDLCAAVAVTLGIAGIKSTADGAMQKSVYDSDGNGKVDDSDKVNGHSVESNVPADAVFTDTVYDDTAIRKSVTDEAERAAKAEEANAQAVTDETSRAKKAEEANAKSVTDETTRAKKAEQKNADNLAALGLSVVGGKLCISCPE